MNNLKQIKKNASRWAAKKDVNVDVTTSRNNINKLKGKAVRKIAREAAFEEYTYDHVPLDVLAAKYGVTGKRMKKWIEKISKELRMCNPFE